MLVGVAQGFGCYLCVQPLVATSSRGYSQGKFQVGAHGEPGIMSASGQSHHQANADQNLYPRAAGASGAIESSKEYTYPYLSLDFVALAPLVSIGFKTDPFPIIIHP